MVTAVVTTATTTLGAFATTIGIIAVREAFVKPLDLLRDSFDIRVIRY